MVYQNTIECALEMDSNDPLKEMRDRFHIPVHKAKETIYFTGNSLGLQPKSVRAHVEQELLDWAQQGVEGHFHALHPWYSYHEQFPVPLSRILGALPEEVVVMNQLTVNLHLLMATFYRPTKQRYRIICEARAFPSDQYALESKVRLHGYDPADAIVEVSPRAGAHTICLDDIRSVIHANRDSVALVLFGGVNYYSGQVFPMQAITEAAHEAGAYAGFDLAHAVGNVQLDLHQWKVDFACWCSYKYLNSGPGGVAGAFIHQVHASNTSLPRMAGWWGYDKATRFKMEPGFKPMPTAEGWQVSNAPVLSMAAHKAAIEIFEEVGMEALVKKSRLLTGYLFYLLDELNKEAGEKLLEVITPREDGAHGCQVSLLMQREGKAVFTALQEQGIVVDWREPNVIRVAPVPLYNRFKDVWEFVQILKARLQ